MTVREWAEQIVAENIEAWRWGPLSEIEGLAEHVLAVDACEAGLVAALAAGSRRAKTPQAVECEASQSGAESATPTPLSPPSPSIGSIDMKDM